LVLATLNLIRVYCVYFGHTKVLMQALLSLIGDVLSSG